MQISIYINQLAVVEEGLNVDIIDMAIFSFIKDYSHLDKCLKLQFGSDTYYWISHKLIIQEMPLLGISTAAGIMKHITKLIDAGLIERHPNCDVLKKTFYKFGPNYEKILFRDVYKTDIPTTKVEGSPNKSLGSTPNKSLGKQTILIEQTDDITKQSINISTPNNNNIILLDPKEKENTKEKEKVTRPRRTSEDLCLFENSRYYDYELFEAEFKQPEFDNVDISYYYHAVADWSSQKGKKMKDWIATARNFMRSDREKGKLHEKPVLGTLTDKEKAQKELLEFLEHRRMMGYEDIDFNELSKVGINL